MQVHRVIADRADETDDPARASIRHRLELAYGSAPANAGPTMTRSAQGKLRLLTTPRIKRTSMAPKSWPPKLTWWPFRPRPLPNERGKNETEVRPDAPNPRGTWHRSATIRRIALFALVVVPTGFATVAMAAILPYHGSGPLEMAMLILFAILFCWTSMGFWTATMGFLLLLSGRDRYAISRSASGTAPIPDEARTAIVMPICNEDVARVFVGLRATYESLARTGKLGHFDFFVLSDSSNPDIRTAEVDAWLNLCREAGGFGRVFYRWRKYRVKRKSGNIADFCRRWGADYRYMVVLDADSVMSGECLARLVQLMEANPNAGIIQTVPRSSGRATLYARIQQFANRVYGPLFTAGLHFWQLGESHYWGHNAIIRVVPFMRHCALGRLPGRGVLSGEILSHDFVEAALMRRAGWAVWIAYDLPGSHEQMPPNLLDELQRDRRWCLGNLINSRLFLAEGLHPAHRAVFATGVMAYFSALLWFLFLLLSTALLAMHTLVTPRYFTQPGQLFPEWPEWHFDWAVALGIVTLVLLFLPKILGVIVIWARGARRFRGWRLVLSMLAELFFSMLLAPIRMLFHTQFIVTAMMRGSAQWKSPPRRDSETTWAEALRRHGWHTLLGVAWTGGVYWLNPAFLWWLLPVVGALSLSIPISVYSSRTSAGERLRAAGLFLIPEEDRPPEELQWTQKKGEYAALPGFVDAVADPATNALMCAFGGVRAPPASVQNARRQLMHRALRDGPEALTAQQKLALLNDSIALSLLHFQVWTSPEAHPLWLRVRT